MLWLSDLVFNLLLAVSDVALLFMVTGKLQRKWAELLLVLVLVGAVVTGPGLFHLMRQAAWVLFLHLPLLLIALALLLRDSRRWACLGSAMALLAVGVRAFLWEPHALEVSRHEIISPLLKEPLRIAVLSDIQTDDVGSYESEVLQRALEQKPDLVLLPGDFIQAPEPELREQREKFRTLLLESHLEAPLGVFAVSGNAESQGWERIFEGTSVRILDHKGEVALRSDVSLVGLSFHESFDTQLDSPRAIPGFRIAMGHAPDFALGSVDANLLVAGHTHGGQVRLPFFGPLITFSSVPRQWASGLRVIGNDKHLVVSRGVGLERGNAPRLRFLCPPEIAVLDLLPAD